MKPLARAKERLADVLDPGQRRTLSLAMLTDVCRASTAVDGPVWVLCSDDDAAETARAAGAEPHPDPTPEEGLNASLNAATHQAIAAGAEAVLIISADVPAVGPQDVRALVLGEGIALAPNRSGTGTNALWRKPPGIMPVFYGPQSRRAHEGFALARGIPCAIVTRQALAMDVDEPRDLEAVGALPLGDATREVLASLGYPRGGR
jgi:2-phospho-L-lactate guanylyltransferase